MTGPSAAALHFMNDLTAFGHKVATTPTNDLKTGSTAGDSLMLFTRLWSNYRGYIVLWKAGHTLEAGIVLRCCLECAICLAANEHSPEDFRPLLLEDLAATMKKMGKLYAEMGLHELGSSFEASRDELPPGIPAKPQTFQWKTLAELGKATNLYEDHRLLSATAAHVTALSLVRGIDVVGTAMRKNQAEFAAIERSTGPMIACLAFLTGVLSHLVVLADHENLTAARELMDRLDVLSRAQS